MRLKNIIYVIFCIITLACTHDENEVQVKVITPDRLEYDASCQRDTIRFLSNVRWAIEVDCDWLTIIDETGNGNGVVPIYIQQNDGEEDRCGNIILHFEGMTDICISVLQNQNSLNSINLLSNLPKTFGIGWGYDYSVDHADNSGIRGQVIDAAKLEKTLGDDFIMIENNVHTHTESVSEMSSTQLISSMTTKLTGETDIKIASAKVSGEFSKQESENKDRIYVWFRDTRAVKMGYISTSEYRRPTNLKKILTEDFKTYVNKLKKNKISTQDFVKKYGTHFINETYLGGKFDWYFTVSQDIKETVETIITTVSVKLLFWSSSTTTVNQEVWQEIQKDFTGSFIVTGGGEKGKKLNAALQTSVCNGEPLAEKDRGLIGDWQSCFIDPETIRDEEMAIIDFEVIPIWEIVDCLDSSIAQKLKEYICNEYLK